MNIKWLPATNKINTGQISHNLKSFKMLDLYCGAGLASWGYWLSGYFSEIVGIDIEDHENDYSFDFIKSNALSMDYEFLSQFDFIHASPPCQAYSKRTPNSNKGNHKMLIHSTHTMLIAVNKPYVIENVEGSGRELRPNIVINGQSVGLPMDRRRYFHASSLKCQIRNVNRLPGTNKIHGDASREDVIKSMGLDMINPNALNKITVKHMLQGIPPAMTMMISNKLFKNKIMIG